MFSLGWIHCSYLDSMRIPSLSPHNRNFGQKKTVKGSSGKEHKNKMVLKANEVFVMKLFYFKENSTEISHRIMRNLYENRICNQPRFPSMPENNRIWMFPSAENFSKFNAIACVTWIKWKSTDQKRKQVQKTQWTNLRSAFFIYPDMRFSFCLCLKSALVILIAF